MAEEFSDTAHENDSINDDPVHWDRKHDLVFPSPVPRMAIDGRSVITLTVDDITWSGVEPAQPERRLQDTQRLIDVYYHVAAALPGDEQKRMRTNFRLGYADRHGDSAMDPSHHYLYITTEILPVFRNRINYIFLLGLYGHHPLVDAAASWCLPSVLENVIPPQYAEWEYASKFIYPY
ncbi:hypothetical protein S40285_09945 [Stachybotrys chlorohalonatus IBT 40285]|uniref:Uncharacterized protein n=1 Tax=Stachybotrys chlorohalonatus (strain IBT 40285) TaxID=1283841 RepID=A0A084QHC3_STAC4|nr:hypothetical protein S40285_09945 [Stachybotrys chlorohalonata IBT 40285]